MYTLTLRFDSRIDKRESVSQNIIVMKLKTDLPFDIISYGKKSFLRLIIGLKGKLLSQATMWVWAIDDHVIKIFHSNDRY